MNSDNKFPPLLNDRYVKACLGENVDKVPVWVMRQAGRYMPEFREFRKKHDFFEICRTPELACEVTLMPIERYDLDAAIIFSDILVVPQALGMEVEMLPGVGPSFPKPLETPEQISALNFENVGAKLQYVGEAITLTRKRLNGKVPLIGFSGGPWTLMGYMIEGGGTKTMSKAKKWLYRHPTDSKHLLSQLTDAIIDYLVMQVKHGAQSLQVFESSAEYLNPYLFREFLLPYVARISLEVKDRIKKFTNDKIPMTLFAKGGNYCLEEQSKIGYDVIGVDWTITPAEARRIVGPNVTLQGNLDPPALYADEATLRKVTETMVTGFGKDRYIANLGHGIYPDMSVESVQIFVDQVHKMF